MADITYCKSWFRAKKRAVQVWDMEDAKQAHEARQAYTVLLGDPGQPWCFLEVNNDFVGVSFLDTKLRENLTYQFQEIESGKLFLSMATYREFDGDTDKVAIGTTYTFNQDSSIQIRKETFNPHSVEVSDANGDVAGNYEPYPKFGCYSDIATPDRN